MFSPDHGERYSAKVNSESTAETQAAEKPVESGTAQSFTCPLCLQRLIEIAFVLKAAGLAPEPLCVPKTHQPPCFVREYR